MSLTKICDAKLNGSLLNSDCNWDNAALLTELSAETLLTNRESMSSLVVILRLQTLLFATKTNQILFIGNNGNSLGFISELQCQRASFGSPKGSDNA